jgi:hypothetical protein
VKPLPTLQAHSILIVFEQSFSDARLYFDLIEMDEVFSYLIGGEVQKGFHELLKKSANFNTANLLMLHELFDWLNVVEYECIKDKLQFFELAQNCLEFKNQINEVLYQEITDPIH